MAEGNPLVDFTSRATIATGIAAGATLLLVGAVSPVVGQDPALETEAASSNAQTPALLIDPAFLEADPDDDLQPVFARVHPTWRSFEPEWSAAPCPFPAQVDYDRDRIQCGYVLVPENRRDPNSRLIRLSIARVRSSEDDPAAGTTVLLSGGPGQAIMDAAPRFVSGVSPWHKNFVQVSHLILPDQRGTGNSEGFFCRGLNASQLDHPDPYSQQSVRQMTEGYQRCLEEGEQRGVDATAYTSWDNAMDMRDIRRALGIEQWNVFGISYGTELAQAVLRVDGEGVRAAVLDSVIAPPPMSWSNLPFGMRSALDAINAACVEHGTCAEQFGDLSEWAEQVVESYRDRPLVLTDLPPEVAPSGQVILNRKVVAISLFQALYDRALYPSFPAMMSALQNRNIEALQAFAEQLAPRVSLAVGEGMGIISTCTGFALSDQQTHEDTVNNEPFWSDVLSDTLRSSACDALGLNELDPLHTNLESDRPVLLAVGTVDPITPPAFAAYVLEGLSNATLVEVPYTGHFATLPECPSEIMTQFLRRPDQSPDTSCIADMPVVDFVTEYRADPAAFRMLRSIQRGQYTGLILPALSVVLLLIALLAYPLAWLGRRLDGHQSIPGYATQRLFAWLAAALALAGIGSLALAVSQTLARAAAVLPLGLIGPTGWIAPLIILSVLIVLLAIVQLLRKPFNSGTWAGLLTVAVSSMIIAGWLTWTGLLI